METTQSPRDTLATEDPQADEKNGAGEESAVALELMTDESEESEGAASLDVSRPRSLAEMLIEAGMLSAEQVRKAEEDARRDSLTLSRVLVRIEWGRRRQWPEYSGWFAPSPSPNRTCPFQGIRLSIRWVRPMCREHQLFRHRRRVRTSLLRRNSLRSTPIRLPSFAMRPAFPTSDYYEGSATRPALAEGWPTPLPESRSRFPSSPRLRLRAVLGSASTPGTARCRARHRETPVDWSSVSLS